MQDNAANNAIAQVTVEHFRPDFFVSKERTLTTGRSPALILSAQICPTYLCCFSMQDTVNDDAVAQVTVEHFRPNFMETNWTDWTLWKQLKLLVMLTSAKDRPSQWIWTCFDIMSL